MICFPQLPAGVGSLAGVPLTSVWMGEHRAPHRSVDVVVASCRSSSPVACAVISCRDSTSQAIPRSRPLSRAMHVNASCDTVVLHDR